MDPSAVFERADVTRRPGDLLPGESDGDEKWLATDPETDCRGVGPFEEAARTNVVYAVEAYHEEYETRGETGPFLSAGRDQTFEMRWLDEAETTIADRLQAFLPF
ncbi:hypothetical protein KTS45_17700 [Halomicroarcula limicola]|uniref:Uncharacterized protein n=1 Tax=Haloarcula limicola TaxID=1429915 RepID=A0A8J7Y870_9EURY|nr:hypothetical protein [Halomicroarcula limicola]MBV0926042.1 hypothetical protein [Halomicroarcula limicola]